MQSDAIFSAKLGSLRKGFKKEIDFTFVRAPHKVPSQDGTGQEDTNENGERNISKSFIKSLILLFYTTIAS